MDSNTRLAAREQIENKCKLYCVDTMCEEHIRVKNRVGQPYNEATRGNQKTIQWPDVGVTTEPKTFQKKKAAIG